MALLVLGSETVPQFPVTGRIPTVSMWISWTAVHGHLQVQDVGAMVWEDHSSRVQQTLVLFPMVDFD